MKKKLNYLVVEVQSYLQWILKTTQIKLIHLLGGYTYEDINKDFKNIYNKGINEGQRRAFKLLHNKISSLYGLSKQEWIDKVWYMITNVRFINNTNNIIDKPYSKTQKL